MLGLIFLMLGMAEKTVGRRGCPVCFNFHLFANTGGLYVDKFHVHLDPRLRFVFLRVLHSVSLY